MPLITIVANAHGTKSSLPTAQFLKQQWNAGMARWADLLPVAALHTFDCPQLYSACHHKCPLENRLYIGLKSPHTFKFGIKILRSTR